MLNHEKVHKGVLIVLCDYQIFLLFPLLQLAIFYIGNFFLSLGILID